MGRKKTHEGFVEEVYKAVGDEYTVLGKYVKAKIYIKMRHNVCGYEYEIYPDSFSSGRRCRRCRDEKAGKSKRKTNEQFIKEVDDAVGDEYTFLDSYETAHKHLRVKHNICEYEYKVTPHNFLASKGGKRCPKCAGNIKKNTDIFKKELFELVGDKYEIIGEYKNAQTYVTMKHTECGHEYSVTPHVFKGKDSRCPKCFKNAKKTQEQFIEEVYGMVGNEYSVLGEYQNSQTKIRMKHTECNHEYLVTPSHFLNTKRRCPKCNESKGEKIIGEWLTRNNIKYEQQYIFDDCKYKSRLRFDFAIFKENDLIMLVEYQGEQHYRAVNWFGGEVDFELRKKRDKAKVKYCKQNDIPLLCISFRELNDVEEILKDKLSMHF
ncbi:hypothetical protein [Priestia megaterium]